jgi:hypothetical protein
MSFMMDEVLCDFPFVDDGAACSASQANACALLLTPIVRPLLGDGRVPLAVLDKPQQGTGASLLAEIMSTIATGRPAAMMSSPRSHAEWRKRITALLAAGVTVVTIDNVDDVLDAPSLAAVLTAKVWSDRPLGHTKIITVPHHATWMATGNNVRLRGDLPRRCYWIRMNAKSARPWQRHAFRHSDLLGWVHAHRGDILAKLLTIARGWVVAGRQEVAVPPLGGFETWAQTLAGILAYAGVAGFLQNLDRLYTEQDHEIGQWSEFLQAWQMIYGAQPMLLSTVVTDLRSGDAAYEDLRHALPDVLQDDLYSKTAQGASRLQRRLGNGFKKFAGRYFDLGLHLEKAGQLHRATRWQVLQG